MTLKRIICVLALPLLLVGCGGQDTPERRGYVHVQLGQWQAAIDAYDEALAANPADAESLTGRGRAKFALQQHDAAMADYNAAIRVDPQYCEAYYLRAILHQAAGDTASARHDEWKARELDPKSRQAKLGQPWRRPTMESLPVVERSPERSDGAANVAAIADESLADDDVHQEQRDEAMSVAYAHESAANPPSLNTKHEIKPVLADARVQRPVSDLIVAAPSKDLAAELRATTMDRLRELSAGARIDARAPRISPPGELAKRFQNREPEAIRPASPPAHPATRAHADRRVSLPVAQSPPWAQRPRGGGPVISPFDRAAVRQPTVAPVLDPSGPPSRSPFAPQSTAAPRQPTDSPVIGPAGPPSQSPFARPGSTAPLRLFEPIGPR